MILALLLSVSIPLGVQDEPPAGETPASDVTAAPVDAHGLTALLLSRLDEAEPELVRRLANLKTSEALDGLIRFYDSIGSVYMRRIALHGFALFDGVSDCEQRAMQKLVDIATLSIEPELRDTAIDELAACDAGRAFLAAIVDSAADDALRERALRHHVVAAKPEDLAWYGRIYGGNEKSDKKERDKRKDEDTPAVHYTVPLRELAFEGLAPSRSVEFLVEDAKTDFVLVRRRALEELAARRAPEAEECAERLLGRRSERPDTRLLAAQVLLDLRGSKFADELYEEMVRDQVPLELAFGVADLLVARDDPALRGKVIRELSQGQELEKRFHMRMAARIPDPKVDKALLQLSKDKDRQVAADALHAMGVRGNPTFIPRLQDVVDDAREPALLGAAIEALNRIRGTDPEWRAELAKLVAHKEEVVRNSALEALGRTQDKTYAATLVQALDHPTWSTRLVAAHGLAALRVPEGVGALCQRIGREEGRMITELADILFALTGKPFRMDANQWKRWWDTEGANFRVPTPEQVAKLQRDRELKDEKQVSRSFRGVKVESRFFGLRIVSHHVAFVVDVSGSMDWRLGGQNATEGEIRMDVAKRELLACLEALEAGTHFNILPFADGAFPWKDAAVEATEETFTEAKEFVQELGSMGGTNVHGGLRAAFDDESVDTIIFLSDGEPSTGDFIDPAAIREEIKALNQQRGVVIHTISIGDRFPLLEWLATDSGGSYRTYP